MTNVCAPFEGKRITVMGLGLLGRAVGDAEFLARCGAQLLVTDKKSEAQLAESVERLKQYPNVSFHLGGHRIEDFTNCDLVLKAAGVRLDSPEIAAARAAGVAVAMSTALFAKYARERGVTIVGVTGTRGKSTVSHMIYHALVRAGRRAYLGGNVRGVSTLALLPAVQSGDIAVLELDSWQLQGFGDLAISPQVAVFSSLMPDHQNYYRTMDEYFADKAHIFKHQKPGDTLVIGVGLEQRVLAAHPPVSPLVPEEIAPDWSLKIPGEHNRHNAALAASALLALGMTSAAIQDGLESFEGVEGRLQLVGEKRSVRIYNDNNATTPEATIAALRAVGTPKERQVILLMGGDDKGLDMTQLVDEIPLWCKAVVLFKERGTDRVRDAIFAHRPSVQVYEEEGLRACVDRAFALAQPGDTLLFSPAFSSFGKYFKNEYDRSDQFMQLIAAIR